MIGRLGGKRPRRSPPVFLTCDDRRDGSRDDRDERNDDDSNGRDGPPRQVPRTT